MNCLTLERLYSYLEGELAAGEKQEIEKHIASCSACRNAIEDRGRILEVVAALPDIEIPPEFARGIMDRIPVAAPKKTSPTALAWLAAGSAGILAFGLALAAFALISGQSLTGLFIRFHRGLWSYVKDAASVTIKLAKFLMLAVKVLGGFLDSAAESLRIFVSLISPEAWAVFVGTLLLVFGAFALGWRKYAVEKHHEK